MVLGNLLVAAGKWLLVLGMFLENVFVKGGIFIGLMGIGQFGLVDDVPTFPEVCFEQSVYNHCMAEDDATHDVCVERAVDTECLDEYVAGLDDMADDAVVAEGDEVEELVFPEICFKESLYDECMADGGSHNVCVNDAVDTVCLDEHVASLMVDNLSGDDIDIVEDDLTDTGVDVSTIGT